MIDNRGGGDLRVTLFKLAITIMAIVSLAPLNAQDDTDPCGPPTDKKIVKMLEDAAKAKDAVERHQKLKAALEIDGECAECLFRLGLSAYRIGKESGKGYEASIRYLEQLQAKCPQYHSDVPYHLGTMYYAQDKFAEAARAFEAFLRFPTEDPTKVSKDYDKKYKDVEEVMLRKRRKRMEGKEAFNNLR